MDHRWTEGRPHGAYVRHSEGVVLSDDALEVLWQQETIVRLALPGYDGSWVECCRRLL